MESFLKIIQKDISRYSSSYSMSSPRIFSRNLINQKIWAIAIYRFGHWACFSCSTPLINVIFKFIYIFLNKAIVEILLGLYIPAQCQIGGGLYLAGFLGLVINPNVKIGENCTIGHGVVIGTAGDGTPRAPEIGDNVYIGAGAVLLGGIKIGDNVRIGANSVVIHDVPSDVTVAGVPSKIVRRKK
jgi:serine O-acetyltransferase